jgi:hypothetical protein
MNRHALSTLVALLSATLLAPAADSLRRESFDRDPGWEGVNNRIVAEKLRTITQDFGYSPQTNHAGGQPGEIGGRVARTSRLAYYAVKIPPRTLNDKFSASGAFTFTETAGTSGVCVGFFNDQQPETARPTNSLTMNFDTEASGARLAVRLITANNESCGKFVTHFIPGKFRPTPLRKGQRYEWKLDYDPAAANGNGQFTYTLSGHNPTDPIDNPITVDLTPGFKQQGTTFNRFGIANMRKAGNTLAVWLDDVAIDGQKWDFATDPQWEGVGNRVSYAETDPPGAHSFGYSATNFAGGNTGEIGGIVWRTTFASYADAVGPFTLDQPLVARGRVAFTGADPDSGAYLGWFSSGAKDDGEKDFRNFVGVQVEGPTRIGHYFMPRLATAKGTKAAMEKGPVLRPDGKPHTWTLSYDPAANEGRGAITVTLDEETVTLNLRDKVKAEGATLDRFGLFSSRVGGSKVKIWLDDLEYTSEGRAPARP